MRLLHEISSQNSCLQPAPSNQAIRNRHPLHKYTAMDQWDMVDSSAPFPPEVVAIATPLITNTKSRPMPPLALWLLLSL
ncbi:hypothetical protein M408DRAFT_328346 [Serendipita vermifera MAFF 305830]|uniref:Uncharacterized protein n=1 Tax=Serendipita vermifera MAFF 305830 TaxID=933852 RepID=A0A0C3BDW6_SERVB|nr:hypothetical protein M408DRAFT_328346 [Serendipita vermifera MAFF 305830]